MQTLPQQNQMNDMMPWIIPERSSTCGAEERHRLFSCLALQHGIGWETVSSSHNALRQGGFA